MESHLSDSSQTHRLLEQARAGNAEAFEELFERHRPFLRQVIEWRMDRGLRQRLDASDLVQEAQLEAARRLRRYLDAPGLSFKIWLRQITYDRLLMARRRHLMADKRAVGREHVLPDDTSLQLVERVFAAGPSPSQLAIRGELATRVAAVMGRLSEADREVLVMRHLEGLSNKQMAEILGVEPAAVSKRHGRALLRLREMLVSEESMG